MELLWFILASYGLTQILVYGSIFGWLRQRKGLVGELFACPMCTGFWVGVLLFCLNGFTELFSYDYNLTNLMVCGWLSSGTSYVLCTLFDDDGIKLSRSNKE